MSAVTPAAWRCAAGSRSPTAYSIAENAASPPATPAIRTHRGVDGCSAIADNLHPRPGVARYYRAMKLKHAALLVVTLAGCGTTSRPSEPGIDSRQTPTWSIDDERFFFHGSMGNEFVPERMLRAFLRAYPDLFPGGSLAAFGVAVEPGTSWPIGFSRRD